MSAMVQRRRVPPPPMPGGSPIDRVTLAKGGRMAFVCADGPEEGIWVGDTVDPSSARRIIAGLELGLEDLAWSPDGEHLAYRLSATLGGRPAVAWASATAAGEIGRVEGAAFAWTPRGKALIVADPGRRMIARYAVPSGRRIDLWPFEDDLDPGFPPQIAISSDGKRIALTVGREGEDVSEVWIIDRHGRKVSATLFTEIPGASVHVFPFWSKKSVSLALSVVHYEQQKSAIIAVRKLEGEGVVLYESAFPDPPIAPVWSPSGERIVFFRADYRDFAEDESAPAVLCLLDARRESFVAITDPGEMSGKLRFLDDRTLAVDGVEAAHVLSFAEPP